jgi:hypothetical protein
MTITQQHIINQITDNLFNSNARVICELHHFVNIQWPKSHLKAQLERMAIRLLHHDVKLKFDRNTVSFIESKGLDYKNKQTLSSAMSDLYAMKIKQSESISNINCTFHSAYLLATINHSELSTTLKNRLRVLRQKFESPIKRKLP